MHTVLQSAFHFHEGGFRAERKLLSLTSASVGLLPYINNSTSAWEVVAACAPILFCLSSPNSSILLVDMLLVPLLQKLTFTTNHSLYLELSTYEFALRNSIKGTHAFKFLKPQSILKIMETVINGSEAMSQKTSIFRSNNIPLRNTLAILSFYKSLFSQTKYLQIIYQQSRDALSNGLRDIYQCAYRSNYTRLGAHCGQLEVMLMDTIAALFFHMTLIAPDIVVDVLLLNPLQNIYATMKSRRGGLPPHGDLDLEAFSTFCAALRTYSKTCAPSTMHEMNACLSKLSTISLKQLPPPLYPFLFEDGEPVYQSIVSQQESTDTDNEYSILLFINMSHCNEEGGPNVQSYVEQGLKLHTDILGEYSTARQQASPLSSKQGPVVLFSSHAPEAAPLHMFLSAVHYAQGA